jgi:hypothetical protein
VPEPVARYFRAVLREGQPPGQGRWFDYAVHDGLRIPLRGEVEWLLPEGPQPYWRGRLVEVAYELAEPS